MDYSWFAIILPIIFVLLIAVIGYYINRAADPNIYQSLKKPFNVPPAVFGIVWPILYIMIAISWVRYNLIATSSGIIQSLFVINLLLNLSWSYVFFYLQEYYMGIIIIILMILTLIILLYYLYSIDSWCFWLLIPYGLWLLFALYLNVQIVILN